MSQERGISPRYQWAEAFERIPFDGSRIAKRLVRSSEAATSTSEGEGARLGPSDIVCNVNGENILD